MRKRLYIVLLLISCLIAASCTVEYPAEEDWYFGEDVYIYGDLDVTGTVSGGGIGSGNVTSTNVIGDDYLVRGDGGARGVQDSLVTINDFGTLYAPVVTAGNIDSTGKVEADRLLGGIEGYSIDVVQASDSNIALNDTWDLVFLFEPSVIVLDYSTRMKHDTTLEVGHTTGHCVITVTGVDTITSNLNITSIYDNNGSMAMTAIQDNTTRVLWAYGGNDGADDSLINASATWDTGTHTLTITFVTVSNTLDSNNYIEMVATAYR